MKKHFLIIVLTVLIILMGACGTNINAATPTIESATTITPTITITSSIKPTTKAVLTPTLTPSPTTTLTPTNTPTPIPSPTTTPTSTPTPIPSPTTTPTSTPTPIPSPTTTPTPTPIEYDGELLAEVQMGDHIWYKYYYFGDKYIWTDVNFETCPACTLVVAGYGEVWNFENEKAVTDRLPKFSIDNTYTPVTKLIIEEGVTKIGSWALADLYCVEKVTIPGTLKIVEKYAFNKLGYNVTRAGKTVVWEGLNLEELDVTSKSFYYASGLNEYKGAKNQELIPVPKTDKIKNWTALGAAKDGDIWFAYYKTSKSTMVLVVYGEGAISDYTSEIDSIQRNRSHINIKNYYDLEGIIIDEGITRVGQFAFERMQDISYVEFPSTLKEIGPYAFRYCGRYADSMTWIGLDLSKVQADPYSFSFAGGLDGIEGMESVSMTTVPYGDSSNPKLITEYQVAKTLSMELWDNGTVYMTGSGQLYHAKSYASPAGQLLKQFPYYEESHFFTCLKIQEGITGFKVVSEPMLWNFQKLADFKEVWLPTTFDLEKLNTQTSVVLGDGAIVHCYYNGNKLIVSLSEYKVEEAEEKVGKGNIAWHSSIIDLNELATVIVDMCKNNKTLSEPELEKTRESGKYYYSMPLITIEYEE